MAFSSTANAQLSDNNRPKASAQPSRLSQITLVDADISDVESITDSIAESEAVDLDDNVDLIATLFASEADKDKIKKKKDQKTKQIDRANKPTSLTRSLITFTLFDEEGCSCLFGMMI